MDPAVTQRSPRSPSRRGPRSGTRARSGTRHEQRWVSDAQVAETAFTAFTSHPKKRQVTCRLVVRRVAAPQPRAAAAGQDELFATWRHHAFITNSTLTTVAADETHRDHAIIEQVIAELKDGPLAHAPSGRFHANAAWLALAAVAFNLLRAAGAAASTRHAKARWATLRTHLINIPARIASSARRLVLHLPTDWPWADRLARPLGHRHRHLTTRPDRPRGKTRRGKAGQTGRSPRPSNRRRIIPTNAETNPQKSHRWIRAESADGVDDLAPRGLVTSARRERRRVFRPWWILR